MRLLFTVVLLGTSIWCYGQSHPALKAEQARFAAMIAADTVALKTMLAEEMIYVHSNALVETKADFLRSISTKSLIYEQFTPESVQVHAYGRKTAVVTGLTKAKGKLNGNVFEVRLRYTSVYHKKRGRWQMTNWQSTRVN